MSPAERLVDVAGRTGVYDFAFSTTTGSPTSHPTQLSIRSSRKDLSSWPCLPMCRLRLLTWWLAGDKGTVRLSARSL